MRKIINWIFIKVFSDKIKHLEEMITTAQNIIPGTVYTTIKTFDTDGEYYYQRLQELADNDALRFFLIRARDKYLNILNEAGTKKENAEHERAFNQYLGRLFSIDEILREIEWGKRRFYQILEEKKLQKEMENSGNQ